MIAGLLLAMLLVAAPSGAASAAPLAPRVTTMPGRMLGADDGADAQHTSWAWPVLGPRTAVVPYRAPAHEYGAGHRGIDIAASPGTEVRAPAAGVVAFRGVVVDRPLLTVEHPGGYVATFEPLDSALSPGDPVAAGDVIGTVGIGGHAAVGTLHLGVRLDGAYINPMLLFGEVPRAVLLPCCAIL